MRGVATAMSYCAQCGAPLAAGARYCAACGTAVATPTLPGGAPAPPALPAQARRDTGMAQTLILVGAVLGVLLPLFVGMGLMVLGTVFAFVPWWGSVPGVMLGLMALGVILLGLLWAAAALYARNLIAQGRVEQGAVLAVVVGALMLLTGLPMLVLPGLAGILVLAGGISAWSQK